MIEEKKTKCVVVTNMVSIRKLLCELYSPEIVYFLPVIDRVLSFNLIRSYNNIKTIKYYKKQVRIDFIKIKGADIYFFFVSYGAFESWMIKTLAINNTVYYRPAILLNVFSKSFDLKSIVKMLEYLVLYKIYFQPYKLGQKLYLGVSSIFLKAINSKEFVLPDNFELAITKIKRHYHLSNGKVLYLTNGISVTNGKIPEAEYINISNNLLDQLEHKFGRKGIIIKCHPREQTKYSREKDFQEIPNYIPGNLLIDLFDIVIGHSSALLFEFANKGKTVYSTLELFQKDEYEEYKNYLESNLIIGRKINFMSNRQMRSKDEKYAF